MTEGGTSFGPDVTANCALIAIVLWRMAGSPVMNYAMRFTDVKQGVWYAEAVRWAASEKIVRGYSETEFAPERLITREEMAAIINRYAEFKGIGSDASGDLSQFEDESLISDWARNNVSWAVGEGILAGKGDGMLDPQGNTTRAQAALILQRLLEQ